MATMAGTGAIPKRKTPNPLTRSEKYDTSEEVVHVDEKGGDVVTAQNPRPFWFTQVP